MSNSVRRTLSSQLVFLALWSSFSYHCIFLSSHLWSFIEFIYVFTKLHNTKASQKILFFQGCFPPRLGSWSCVNTFLPSHLPVFVCVGVVALICIFLLLNVGTPTQALHLLTYSVREFILSLGAGCGLFFLISLYWSIVDWQCCVSFCCTAKWIVFYLCLCRHGPFSAQQPGKPTKIPNPVSPCLKPCRVPPLLPSFTLLKYLPCLRPHPAPDRHLCPVAPNPAVLCFPPSPVSVMSQWSPSTGSLPWPPCSIEPPTPQRCPSDSKDGSLNKLWGPQWRSQLAALSHPSPDPEHLPL